MKLLQQKFFAYGLVDVLITLKTSTNFINFAVEMTFQYYFVIG